MLGDSRVVIGLGFRRRIGPGLCLGGDLGIVISFGFRRRFRGVSVGFGLFCRFGLRPDDSKRPSPLMTINDKKNDTHAPA